MLRDTLCRMIKAVLTLSESVNKVNQNRQSFSRYTIYKSRISKLYHILYQSFSFYYFAAKIKVGPDYQYIFIFSEHLF